MGWGNGKVYIKVNLDDNNKEEEREGGRRMDGWRMDVMRMLLCNEEEEEKGW